MEKNFFIKKFLTFLMTVSIFTLMEQFTISNVYAALVEDDSGNIRHPSSSSSTSSSTSSSSGSSYTGSIAGMPTDVPAYNQFWNSDGTYSSYYYDYSGGSSSGSYYTNYSGSNNSYGNSNYSKSDVIYDPTSGQYRPRIKNGNYVNGYKKIDNINNVYYNGSSYIVGNSNKVVKATSTTITTNDGTKRYYSGGKLIKDKKAFRIDGVYYSIDKNGKLKKLSNTIVQNHYYDKSGKLVKNKKTFKIQDIYYDIDQNGNLKKICNKIVQNHYYDKNGKLVKNKKTFRIDGKYYDIDKKGELTTVKNEIRGNKYYNKNGELVTNKSAYKIKNVYYEINANGKIKILNNVFKDGNYYLEGKKIYTTNSAGLLISVETNKEFSGWLKGDRYKYGEKFVYKDNNGQYRYYSGSKKDQLYEGKLDSCLYNDGFRIARKNSEDGLFYKYENSTITTDLYTGISDNKYYRNGQKSNEKLLKSCQKITEYLFSMGAKYPERTYLGDGNWSLPDYINKLKYYGNIKEAFEDKENKYFVCSTYVFGALFKSGYLSQDEINASGNIHYADSVGVVLKNKGWEKAVLIRNSYGSDIYTFNANQVNINSSNLDNILQPEDVIVFPGEHTLIYAGNNQYYDNETCLISSYSQPPKGNGKIIPTFWETYGSNSEYNEIDIYRKK